MKAFIEEKSCTALNEIDKWQNAVLGNQPGMFRSDEDDPEVNIFIEMNIFEIVDYLVNSSYII